MSDSLDHPPARRILSDPLVTPLTGFANGVVTPGNATTMLNGLSTACSSSSPAGSTSSSPTESLGSAGKRIKKDCIICFESEVVAALVPCGHNLFCLECANRVCDKGDPECLVCHQLVNQAIRIYS